MFSAAVPLTRVRVCFQSTYVLARPREQHARQRRGCMHRREPVRERVRVRVRSGIWLANRERAFTGLPRRRRPGQHWCVVEPGALL